MLPGPELARPMPKPYGTNSLSTMGYQRRSCWIRAETLKVRWWLTSVVWWGLKRYGPAHTIHKLMANVRGSTPLWLVCWECYPQWRSQSGKTTLECWSMTILVPEIQLQSSAPTTSCMGDNPNLPVDVTLGLALHTTTAPNTSKCVQKMQEHTKWVQKKAEAIQAKEAQCHKRNYDKWSKAAALEAGDTVLVCVTTFKGHHKIQDQWENREYIVEKWPYPNVPVYLVCPRDGEGCSQTLHRNYLLPISSNREQDEKNAPVAGVESTNTSTPAPPVDGEPADVGPSGMVTSCTAGNTPQGSLINLLHLDGAHKTQNQLPLRYQNFVLLADTSLSGIWDALVGLCIFFHVIFCLYTICLGSTVCIHSTYSIMCLHTTHFGIKGNSLNVVPMVDFWIGEWNKDYLAQAQLPHQKKIQKEKPQYTSRVCSSLTQKTKGQT